MKRLVLIILTIISSHTLLSQNFPNADAQGLSVGDMAPSFSGKDQNGVAVTLQSKLENGPVIVTFFRGEWCRYCIAQLKDIQDSVQFLQQSDISVITVTPAKAKGVTKTADITKASFPIISDTGLEIMHNYKVVTDENFAKYQAEVKSGTDNQHKYLPVPAAYLVGRDGKIIYRYFDPNYRVRPSVKGFVEAL